MSKIITIEGIDGSGKSTLASALRKHYGAAGKVVWQTSEPWSYPAHLIDSDPFVATMQLMADRRKHCQALKDTLFDIALIDRFEFSTEAYQGYGDGVDRDLINTLNDIATEAIDVSLHIYLDLPVGVAVKRLLARDGHMAVSEIARLERVHAGYAKLAEEGWMVRIDATQPPDDVLREAIALIEEIL
jgi:dTMP kinase